MMEPLKLQIGQVVEMKKPHPCGSYTFRIWRVGMDIGIACEKCGRKVMVPRSKLEKNIKKIYSEEETR